MSSIDAIDLHVRTYRSALKSNLELTIHSLTNSYLKTDSILHPYATDSTRLDASVLVYSLLRLPQCIDKTKTVVMGQGPHVFTAAAFDNISSWHKVNTSARRRTCFFNPKTGILASFISSVSDIDDIVNLLIGYQVEWNKFHHLITSTYPTYTEFKKSLNNHNFLTVAHLAEDDWQRLKTAFGKNWRLRLKRIYHHSLDLRLRLLAGSWNDYTKTTQRWWKNLAFFTSEKHHLSRHQIYFVSSNTHSLLNLITGFALKSEKKLLKISPPTQDLTPYLNHQDYLYYLSKFFTNDKNYQQDWQKLQQRLGILTYSSPNYLDLTTQIIPLSSLAKSRYLDSRLQISKLAKLQKSDALILNIDYPLGFAAYHVLSQVMQNVDAIKGLYILGKAAVLNSEIGDLEIPRLVFDEHSQNSYFFRNCFNTFFPFTNTQGSILTNQKSVTVFGTFLENEALLKKYSQNNLTVIEMENGPYLSAVAEATYDQQTPHGALVDLNSAPFDIGIINYTSDTPYSKAKNLGAGSLNLAGVEPVYLGSLAILQRIINLEESI